MAAAAEYAKAKGDVALASAANDAYEVGMDEDFITALEYGMPPTAGMVRIPTLIIDTAQLPVRTHVNYHLLLLALPGDEKCYVRAE